MISTILWYILIGAIVGVVARLVVPGRNPMGIILTILVGVAGAIVGGAISNALGAGGVITFIFAIIIAALGVAGLTAVQRGRGQGSKQRTGHRST